MQAKKGLCGPQVFRAIGKGNSMHIRRGAHGMNSALKRGFFFAGCMFFICSLLYGGGQGDKSAAEKVKETPGTLTVWLGGQWEFATDRDTFTGWYKKVSLDFEKEHPGTKVELVYLSDDTYLPQLAAAGEASAGPDITYLWPGIFCMEFVWKGYIEPIDSYFPSDELKQYMGVDQRLFEGKHYGVPHYTAGKPLFYNKEILKKVGVDPDDAVSTWEKFMKACERVKQAGYIGVALGAKDWYGGYVIGNFSAQVIDSPGGMMDMALGIKQFNSYPFLKVWETQEQIARNGYAPPDADTIGLWPGMEYFDRGEAAFVFNCDINTTRYIKLLGEDALGVAKVPRFGNAKQADRYVFEAQAMGITTWSPRKQAAAQWLGYLHKPAIFNDYYETVGNIPPDLRFDPSRLKYPQLKKIYKWLKEGTAFWGENFYPTLVDGDGAIQAGQLVYNKELDAKGAAQMMDDIAAQWRKVNASEVENFKKWRADF